MIRFCVLLVVVALISSHLTGQVVAQKIPTLKEPVLLTSCGQSPGPLKIQVFLKKLGIIFTYNLQAKAEDLVKSAQAGKPFGSVIIVTGSSLKGMGAAGVSIDDEIARTTKIIEEVRKQKITLVGAQCRGHGTEGPRSVGWGQFGRAVDRRGLSVLGCPRGTK